MSGHQGDRKWVVGAAAARRFAPGVERLQFEIEPEPARGLLDHEAREWERSRAANRRLTPGEILSGVVTGDGLVHARRERYERLVVRSFIVTQLSISAATLAPDADGRPCVLLGQRGRHTRLYGGQWQICPSGGIDPPARGVTVWDHADLLGELERELREETGLEIADASASLLGVVSDGTACSDDILFRLDFPRTLDSAPQPASRWEHAQLTWVPLDAIDSFARHHRLVDSTRAVLAMLRYPGGMDQPL